MKHSWNKRNVELVVIKKYGVVLKSKNLELRLVKWVPDDKEEKDVEAKLDIRSWYVDEEKEVELPNKGTVTFTLDELKELSTNIAEMILKIEEQPKPQKKRGRKAKTEVAAAPRKRK